MSSFAGHTLAAASIYTLSEYPPSTVKRAGWLGCLILAACAPDIDYFLPDLRIGLDQTIRVTHSFVGSLALPSVTILAFVIFGLRGTALATRSRQVIAAGLSHLVLDLLVGVSPLPLFWPFSLQTVRLPFGILPSAGRIDWQNPLLYQNLLIEMGVLMPIVLIAYLIYRKRLATAWQKITSGGLAIVSIYFMIWAYGLSR